MEGKNNLIGFTGRFQDESKANENNSKVSSPENSSVAEVPQNYAFSLFDQCLVDYSGRQFACVHDHCQRQSSCFKTGQLQERLSVHELKFHPEDRMLWCDEAYPDIVKFVKSEKKVEFPDYRFIFNHRYIRKDGSISQFMHEGALTFKNEVPFPVLNLKVFFEIADIKSDDTIILNLFRYSEENGYQKVFSKVYGEICFASLTKREMEIVRLCQKGLSSKMIAEKLNLSIHTVKNHKRNCMEKTLTHNISELIHCCNKSNWL